MPIYEQEDLDRMKEKKEMELAKRAALERKERDKKQVDDWMKWVEESWRGL